MSDFKSKEYKIFEMFNKDWAIVAAGNSENNNGCTVGWGSMGTLWVRPGGDGSVVTVYIHPGRHTLKFLQENDKFTVSFFGNEYRKALGYMGTKSGRDEDKAHNAGLTPIDINGTVGYAEAKMTIVCNKLYAGMFDKDGIHPHVQEYYKSKPEVYPLNEAGEWEPHWMFVGEIEEVIEK